MIKSTLGKPLLLCGNALVMMSWTVAGWGWMRRLAQPARAVDAVKTEARVVRRNVWGERGRTRCSNLVSGGLKWEFREVGIQRGGSSERWEFREAGVQRGGDAEFAVYAVNVCAHCNITQRHFICAAHVLHHTGTHSHRHACC